MRWPWRFFRCHTITFLSLISCQVTSLFQSFWFWSKFQRSAGSRMMIANIERAHTHKKLKLHWTLVDFLKCSAPFSFSDDHLVAYSSGGEATVLVKVDLFWVSWGPFLNLLSGPCFWCFWLDKKLDVKRIAVAPCCPPVTRCRSILYVTMSHDVPKKSPSFVSSILLVLQSFPGIPKTVLELAKTTSDSCRPTSSTTRLNTLDAFGCWKRREL